MRKIKSLQKVPYSAPDVAIKQVPAPVEGWDAISPLSNMDPKRAPILINWVPRTGWIELRSGYAPWAQMISTTPVETLMTYRSPSLGEKLFAASNGKIFDVSSELAISYSAVQSGLTNNRWQYTNFTPAGAATVLQCVNGSDTMRQWNGSSWTAPNITGLASGITTANFINILSFKRRLWYVVENTTYVVYLPTDAISGAIAGTLDVGPMLKKGGYLVALATWTIDGGNGPDDYFALISSQGEIIIYQGTDPTDATQWAIVGVFSAAKPIGYRCALPIGSDTAIITLMGVLPLSQILPFDPAADRSVAITARIQNAMAQAAQLGQNLFGWQIITFPAQSLLILNVPQVENETQVQYVSNLLNGAWCQFQGWNANCFEIFNQNLYWGDNLGNVNQGYIGGSDFNTNILADMQCAFNYFEDPGRHKRMTMIEPFLLSSGQVTPSLSIDYNFQSNTTSAPVTTIPGTVLWDQAIWDQSLWPDSNTTSVVLWYSTTVIDANCYAVRMKVNLAPSVPNSTFDFAQFDFAQFDGIASPDVILQVNMFNVCLEYGGTI